MLPLQVPLFQQVLVQRVAAQEAPFHSTHLVVYSWGVPSIWHFSLPWQVPSAALQPHSLSPMLLHSPCKINMSWVGDINGAKEGSVWIPETHFVNFPGWPHSELVQTTIFFQLSQSFYSLSLDSVGVLFLFFWASPQTYRIWIFEGGFSKLSICFSKCLQCLHLVGEILFVSCFSLAVPVP